MIEALVTPSSALREPWRLFFLAVLFVSIAVIMSVYVPSIAGGAVLLAMIPAIPLIWTLLVREEHREEDLGLLARDSFRYHAPLFTVFTFFFLGATVAYAFWFAALPASQSQTVFGAQVDEIARIRGAVAPPTGSVINTDFAVSLFEHNLVVLAFMFAFCLLYGIGSIYLLLWNASIIGVFIGSRIAGGPAGAIAGFMGIIPHGSLEIGAYFLATIAGGILSAGIMRQHFGRREFRFILKDVALLTLAAVGMLAAGAILESL